jgi:hypothetical protein
MTKKEVRETCGVLRRRRPMTKEEVREMWIERLETTEIRQATGVLGKSSGERCCLGVLCDIAVELGAIPPPEADAPSGLLRYGRMLELGDAGTISYLPNAVSRLVGMGSNDGRPHTSTLPSLTQMNDKGIPFAKIAKTLREHGAEYFAGDGL